MPDSPVKLDEHLFRQTVRRADMTMEALFRGIYRHVDVTGDPFVTCFHMFRMGAQLGREFGKEMDELDREFLRRAARDVAGRRGL